MEPDVNLSGYNSAGITEGGGGGMGDIIGGISKLVGMGLDWYRGDKAAKAEDQRYRNQLIREDSAIQRKVADAKLAGIHPVYALGGSGAAAGPYVSPPTPTGVGEQLGSAGQSIGRAVQAYMSPEDKANQHLGETLELERKSLTNDILRAKLASMVATDGQPGSPPGLTLANPSGGTDPAKIDQEKRKTGLQLFGSNIANDPYTSDAQEAEDVLGEGVSDTLWPFLKIPSMYAYNAKLAGAMIASIMEGRRRRAGGFPLPLKDRRRTTFRQDVSDYMRYRRF